MLSYRHAFHAGNYADVVKHFVLTELLAYYRKKDKPWTYIDTHAGAGCYALDAEVAGKTGEFADGIERLWSRGDLPEPLAAYVEIVRQFNPGGRLLFYPGSPAVAMTFARERDSLQLFELHPEDLRMLRRTFSTEPRRVHVRGSDGLVGLDALLPPPSRRAVVLIDPSYEVKTDYSHVVATLDRALRRFATGCFVLWYPLLARAESRRLPEQLKKIGAGSWLDVRFRVSHALREGFGMFGCGLYVINPPWVLPERLQTVLPWLVGALGADDGAGFELDSHIE
ncbi:MAG: 23S rRNA (adenine(2030)-N(6))-methyltransferase RlmJ [Proteobacteria bacterium]|jgi:23S rRNA (adenine2030-N6)-methyltransferase|nr:23S rRNA (adenine(2030)-N(6))-methyltransferase RlmJ [Pseudomonadota bacterium]